MTSRVFAIRTISNYFQTFLAFSISRDTFVINVLPRSEESSYFWILGHPLLKYVDVRRYRCIISVKNEIVTQ